MNRFEIGCIGIEIESVALNRFFDASNRIVTALYGTSNECPNQLLIINVVEEIEGFDVSIKVIHEKIIVLMISNHYLKETCSLIVRIFLIFL